MASEHQYGMMYQPMAECHVLSSLKIVYDLSAASMQETASEYYAELFYELCCLVYNSCVHNDAHVREQFLNFYVGLGFILFLITLDLAVFVFDVTLGH